MVYFLWETRPDTLVEKCWLFQRYTGVLLVSWAFLLDALKADFRDIYLSRTHLLLLSWEIDRVMTAIHFNHLARSNFFIFFWCAQSIGSLQELVLYVANIFLPKVLSLAEQLCRDLSAWQLPPIGWGSISFDDADLFGGDDGQSVKASPLYGYTLHEPSVLRH